MDDNLIKKLEKMSGFSLSPEERARAKDELDELVVMITMNEDAGLDGGTAEISSESLREDEIISTNRHDEWMANAKHHEAGLFLAPPAIGEDAL